eukprot:gene5633-biopygen1954
MSHLVLSASSVDSLTNERAGKDYGKKVGLEGRATPQSDEKPLLFDERRCLDRARARRPEGGDRDREGCRTHASAGILGDGDRRDERGTSVARGDSKILDMRLAETNSPAPLPALRRDGGGTAECAYAGICAPSAARGADDSDPGQASNGRGRARPGEPMHRIPGCLRRSSDNVGAGRGADISDPRLLLAAFAGAGARRARLCEGCAPAAPRITAATPRPKRAPRRRFGGGAPRPVAEEDELDDDPEHDEDPAVEDGLAGDVEHDEDPEHDEDAERDVEELDEDPELEGEPEHDDEHELDDDPEPEPDEEGDDVE